MGDLGLHPSQLGFGPEVAGIESQDTVQQDLALRNGLGKPGQAKPSLGAVRVRLDCQPQQLAGFFPVPTPGCDPGRFYLDCTVDAACFPKASQVRP
jgi:hypothetical protein